MTSQHWMRVPLAIVFWIHFWIVTIVLFSMLFIARPFYLLLGIPRFDLLCHKFAYYWSSMILIVVPGWKIRVHGIEHLKNLNKRPAVLVINHESMTDIWILCSLNIQFRWLSKAEVFKVPVIGWAMRWAGYIPIQRGDKSSHMIALARSAEWLQRGVSMAFFPEGTRSNDGVMRPFKVGAFKVAAESGYAVLPVVLSGTGNLLPKGAAIPCPATVDVDILQEVSFQPDETYQSYADRVRAMMIAVKAAKKNGEGSTKALTI